MSRVRSIGRLSLTPSMAPGDVARVAREASLRGLWVPCAEGCCLSCAGSAPGDQLAQALRGLMRSVLTLAGVRRVHGSVAVVHEGRVVTVTVSHNRITHRTGSPGGTTGHPPAAAEGPRAEGGGEVISMSGWL